MRRTWATGPIEPAAFGTKAERATRGARGWRLFGAIGRRWSEECVVDEATGEGRVLAVDIEPGAQGAGLRCQGRVGEDDRNAAFGDSGEVTVAGQQGAALGGAAGDDLGIAESALGNRCVVAGRAQPAAEPGQHFIAEQAHAAFYTKPEADCIVAPLRLKQACTCRGGSPAPVAAADKAHHAAGNAAQYFCST